MAKPYRIIPALSEQDITRFWSHVDKCGVDECWIWTGCTASGYGLFHVAGQMYQAHRIAWSITSGDIPDGFVVCHRCDVRVCANAKHMFVGTQTDNMRDASAKGRIASGDRNGTRLHPETVARGDKHPSRVHPEYMARGESHGHAVLTVNQVLAIREMYRSGTESRDGLARAFGVHESNIRSIVCRRTWRHI